MMRACRMKEEVDQKRKEMGKKRGEQLSIIKSVEMKSRQHK